MNRLLLRHNSTSVDDDLQVSLDERLRYILIPVDSLDNVVNFGIIIAFLLMVSLVALAAYCIPVCCVNCNCCEHRRVDSSRQRKRRRHPLLPADNPI